MVAAGARLGRSGLLRGREGNLSCRLDSRHILLTPAGCRKDRLVGHRMVRCRLGEPLAPGASSEGLAHLASYEGIPGLAALAHAHPPGVLAVSAAGMTLDPGRLVECESLIPAVGQVARLMPGSGILASACAQELIRAPVVILADHGVFARGATMDEAVGRIETLELLAQVTLFGWNRSRV